jgi:hypothetical protein
MEDVMAESLESLESLGLSELSEMFEIDRKRGSSVGASGGL